MNHRMKCVLLIFIGLLLAGITSIIAMSQINNIQSKPVVPPDLKQVTQAKVYSTSICFNEKLDKHQPCVVFTKKDQSRTFYSSSDINLQLTTGSTVDFTYDANTNKIVSVSNNKNDLFKGE